MTVVLSKSKNMHSVIAQESVASTLLYEASPFLGFRRDRESQVINGLEEAAFATHNKQPHISGDGVG